VRQLQNSIAVVPNSSVAKSTIVNYDLPEPRLGIAIRVVVDYASDPDRVEALLVDEARRAVGEVPGLLGEPAPSARLVPGFGESGLEFTLGCHVGSYVEQYVVQHELRKRILRRFHAEGIAVGGQPRVVALRVDGSAPMPERRA
jgi:small-conductance mechanosensitive channel